MASGKYVLFDERPFRSAASFFRGDCVAAASKHWPFVKQFLPFSSNACRLSMYSTSKRDIIQVSTDYRLVFAKTKTNSEQLSRAESADRVGKFEKRGQGGD